MHVFMPEDDILSTECSMKSAKVTLSQIITFFLDSVTESITVT